MNQPGFRFTRRLRRALSLLLAAVLALSPVLSTAAQTHEASHAGQGDLHFHAHDHAAAEQADGASRVWVHDEADHEDEMADAGGVLHGLAHAAHACGHGVAILGTSLPVIRADGASAVPAASPTLRLDAHPAHPFRPPIA